MCIDVEIWILVWVSKVQLSQKSKIQHCLVSFTDCPSHASVLQLLWKRYSENKQILYGGLAHNPLANLQPFHLKRISLCKWIEWRLSGLALWRITSSTQALQRNQIYCWDFTIILLYLLILKFYKCSNHGYSQSSKVVQVLGQAREPFQVHCFAVNVV